MNEDTVAKWKALVDYWQERAAATQEQLDDCARRITQLIRKLQEKENGN